MKRAAIYARYSTDLQNERSIEDRIEHCRAFAGKQSFQVVTTFYDRARTGMTMLGRPGLSDMMRAVEERAFDVIIAESLDRIARSQADPPHIFRELTLQGVELISVNEGGRPADAMLIGFRAMMGKFHSRDGAQKVRRGMTGVARQGRYPGGKAYGYEPVLGKLGERQIVEHEAEIVRWIFSQYLSGSTPRQIAHDLNEQGCCRREDRLGTPPPSTDRTNARTALSRTRPTWAASPGTGSEWYRTQGRASVSRGQTLARTG